MSMVSTWVMADDGYMYKNPAVVGPASAWFVCWDDNDPDELVVFSGNDVPDLTPWFERTSTAMRCGSRSVPVDGGWRGMRSARRYWGKTIMPIPVPQLYDKRLSVESLVASCWEYCVIDPTGSWSRAWDSVHKQRRVKRG